MKKKIRLSSEVTKSTQKQGIQVISLELAATLEPIVKGFRVPDTQENATDKVVSKARRINRFGNKVVQTCFTESDNVVYIDLQTRKEADLYLSKDGKEYEIKDIAFRHTYEGVDYQRISLDAGDTESKDWILIDTGTMKESQILLNNEYIVYKKDLGIEHKGGKVSYVTTQENLRDNQGYVVIDYGDSMEEINIVGDYETYILDVEMDIQGSKFFLVKDSYGGNDVYFLYNPITQESLQEARKKNDIDIQGYDYIDNNPIILVDIDGEKKILVGFDIHTAPIYKDIQE